MKALSLFSGMGGDTLGMSNTGVDVVSYSELRAYIQNTHEANFPDSKLLGGDITKVTNDAVRQLGNIDIVFAGFPCFVAGTKVLTKGGYKKIEDVVLEDTLLTHTGSFRGIVNLQKKVYSGDLFELDIKYHSGSIVCTADHPFYVREKTQKSNYTEPTWKSAKDLTLNDHFGMVINSNELTPQFSFDKPVNKFRTDTVSIKLDRPEYWFMMGYFVGDGWIQETTKADGRHCNTIRFAINNTDEREIVDRIGRVLPITDKLCSTGLCKKFGCSDFTWFRILKQFGKYAHGKLIPEWVQDAPAEYIQHFVDGYRKADGCIKKNGSTSFTTVSPDLAFGLQRLYLKLGHIFGIEKTVRPDTCVIEGRTVNQRDTYCVRGYTRDLLRKQSSFIEDNYVWYAPTKITTHHVDSEPVYNFEVETDNSYVVENTLAHNCQGFSNAGKKLPDDPRNTLFREFVRCTDILKPSLIIGENVKGLLSRQTAEGQSYIDVIVGEFERMGYSVIFKVCKAHHYGVPQKRERLIIVGVKNSELGDFNLSFPEENTADTPPGLKNIVAFDMTGAVEVPAEWFEGIPEECIRTNLENDEGSHGAHPYLLSKVRASGDKLSYGGKTYAMVFSFGKRISPIHCEIVDIRLPAKTIICTFEHQPRLFVPLRNKNGCYLRCLLPHELKQIQGFPADYSVTGSTKEQIIQIGNAVPPPLVEKIVRHVCNT